MIFVGGSFFPPLIARIVYFSFIVQTFSTYAVLFQLLLVLVVPLFSGELSVPVDADGNVDADKLAARTTPACARILTVFRYVLLVFMYCGIGTVMYGIHTMQAPAELYPDGRRRNISWCSTENFKWYSRHGFFRLRHGWT